MVPGIEIVDLNQPAVGLMSNFLNALPEYKRGLHLAELEAAEAAGIDALVAIYHPDHRELCAHERDWPFKIVNILDIVGASMGLHHDDHFKRLKIMQDADLIVADCRDMLAARNIDPAAARTVVVKAMLQDQPLPLRGRLRLDGFRGEPYIARHDDRLCTLASPPPPRREGTGAPLVVTPRAAGSAPRHFLPR